MGYTHRVKYTVIKHSGPLKGLELPVSFRTTSADMAAWYCRLINEQPPGYRETHREATFERI